MMADLRLKYDGGRTNRKIAIMKFLMVDDHKLIREGLRGVLKELMDDAVVLEAPNCCQAMQLIAEHPDIGLVLLDRNLPDRDGFSMLDELRERYPAMAVVVLSGQEDRASARKAYDLDAAAFIPKTGDTEVLLVALQLVLAGGRYFPPEILFGEEPSGQQPGAKTPGADRPRFLPADFGLTVRELEVLELMMQGKSNKAICRELNLAEPTVKNHVTAILKALGVSNRIQAVIKVRELGWELPLVPKPKKREEPGS
jgi:DNA-binding NarL/FixJ family response regulator